MPVLLLNVPKFSFLPWARLVNEKQAPVRWGVLLWKVALGLAQRQFSVTARERRNRELQISQAKQSWANQTQRTCYKRQNCGSLLFTRRFGLISPGRMAILSALTCVSLICGEV